MRLFLLTVFCALVFLTMFVLWNGRAGGDGAGSASPEVVIPNEVVGVLDFGPVERRPVGEPDSEAQALEAGGQLAVTVLEARSGLPCVGASVYAESFQGLHFLGVSGENGVVVGGRPPDIPARILVTHPSLCGEERVFREGLPSVVTVSLSEGGTVSGRVLLPEGRPAPEGLLVAAGVTSDAGFGRQLKSWYLGAPSTVSVTTTDGSGRFEISGLSKSGVFQLLAGGQGYLSDLEAPIVSPGDSDVILYCNHLYGARVRLMTEGGVAPDCAMPTGSFFTSIPRDFDGDVVFGLDNRLFLAGIPVHEFADISPFDKLIVASSSENADELAPFEFSIALPGYEALTTRVGLWSARRGFADVIVELPPSAGNLGSLEVRFSGASSGTNPRGMTVAYLHLTDTDRRYYEFPITDFGAPLKLNGLPVGRYDYALFLSTRLVDELGSLRNCAGAVEISSEGAVLSVSVGAVGALEVRPSYLDGSLVWEPARFTVYSDFNTKRASFSFRGPPYILESIPAGVYSVEVDFPMGEGIQKPRSPSVAVLGGEVAVVDVVIPIVR